MLKVGLNMKFYFGKLASFKKIDSRSKKNFKTNPSERSFKIGSKNFSKVFRRYLHSPGSHQSTLLLELLTD